MLGGDPKKEASCRKKTHSGFGVITAMVDLGDIGYVGAEVIVHTSAENRLK